LGVPIYFARWKLTYSLEKEPEAVNPQPNEQAFVEADGTAIVPSGV